MRSPKIIIIILVLSVLSSQATAQNESINPVHKTIFIIVDGISEDVIKEVPTPHLDAITEEGAFLPAYVGGGAGTYSETPTISAVGYNSLLTGTWANKHNVWGNSIKNPNYRYWSIFRFFKEQYPGKTTAVFSTWLDNRTKLIGVGMDATGQLRMDYFFDGFEHDTLKFPHDDATTYIRDIDNIVADEAAERIRKSGPDMSWVYLQFTDNMGHHYGDHPVFHHSIQTMDDQIGQIWKAVKEREDHYNEKWLVVITTDHGRTADTGKDHGGQSERERSIWIVTNENNINQYGRNYRVGLVDIFPSIADFMNITIPQYRAMELDGVTFLGNADAAQFKAVRSGDQINLSWKAISHGKARIWLTPTNKFQYGGEDLYYYVDNVFLEDEEASISIGKFRSEFYKIVLETPHHYLNSWITK